MILQSRCGSSVNVKASVRHLDISCVVLISGKLADFSLSSDSSAILERQSSDPSAILERQM